MDPVPKYVTKTLPVFFAMSDEQRLEQELTKRIPEVRFIDGVLWPTPEPVVKTTLEACTSPVVYLWNRDACPNLPFQRLPDGRARGPTSGVVIQFIRSRHADGILSSGELAIGYDKLDRRIGEFVTGTWSACNALRSASLRVTDRRGCLSGERVTEYVVGPGAVGLAQSGAVLKHFGAEVYYKLENGKRDIDLVGKRKGETQRGHS